LRLDKDKWQKAFEKELDKAEKRQSSKVRRYYKEQYFKGVNSFLSANQTDFQLLFNTSDIIKIYRDLYEDIGLQFAKWYARNFDKYIKKGVNPNQFVDQWANTFAALGSAVGAERVTLVSGTAKVTLVKVTQNLLTDIEFQNTGIDEKTRILRSQFTKYSAFQAQRLVRTEATNAANFATIKSAETIFPAEDLQKEWIAATDERTRPTHRAINGIVINQTDLFSVGDSLMMYPGDSRGSAKEVINCRCSIAPFPKENAQATGEISDIGFGVSFGANQKI
jgi:SPP1 gp7 family putative phage head morphogenesis protein